MVPPSYVDITTALYSRGLVNVIGVVVDVFGDVFKTGGTSLCITFTVKDTNLDNGHSWDGLKVKYFNDKRASLPPVKVNDVVILQNLQVRTFNGKTVAVASQHEVVPWAIYRREPDARTTASPISGPEPFEPSPLDKKYALSLLKRVSSVDTIGHLRAVEAYKSSHSHIVQPSVASPKPSYGSNRLSLIRDIKERTFVMLVCEVVNIYLNDSEKVIIDVTDYTSNEGLWDNGTDDDNGRDGDRFNYLARPKRKRNAALERMTLRITLWDPHAAYARENIQSDQFVRLQNVHIKRGRIYGNLEASMHTDRYHPDRVNIKKVSPGNDEHARTLLARRKEHWAKRYNKEDVPEENTEKPANSKKSKKKKQEKQEKKKEEGQKPFEASKRSRLNEHIKVMNVAIKCGRLEDILANETHDYKTPDGIEYRLPFQNICYRSNIRVVDFFPPNLEDFAVPEEPDQDSSEDGELDTSSDPKNFTSWEWRFCLLVENATPPGPGVPNERMRLFVSGPDAECLLGVDPVNLRTDKEALHELKERLFILWGDLEERKSQALAEGKTDPQSWGPVSSVPFTCCIKEYGVRCSHGNDADDAVVGGCNHEGCFGWERRFAMFQTTIHS